MPNSNAADLPQKMGYVTQYVTNIGYLRLMVAIVLLLLVGVGVSGYPIAPAGLGFFLLVYACLIWRFSAGWLFGLPALLPIMDFTPWTGRFFFDEFDLLILTTIAVTLCEKPVKCRSVPYNKTTVILLSLYGLFYFVSLVRGLFPLQAIDANAFSNYYSHYNALRVGKGVLWGYCLLPAFRQALNIPNALRYFFYGMLSGLTGVILFALYERLLFTGLMDFSSHYRINALFSTMHTGGGHIESYLMLSLPFIAVLFFKTTSLLAKIWGCGLFVGGLYVLLVTFSRGGYIGFAVGFLVLLLCLFVRYKAMLRNNWRQVASIGLLLLTIPLFALPVFRGQLIKQRFSIFSEDKSIRTQHWLDTLNMMDDDLLTRLLGMGLGSHPRTYFWLNTENVVPATYKIENENGNTYLQLRGGDALFMGQALSIKPHHTYQLQLDARTNLDKMALGISICEKSLIYSLRCSDISLPVAITAKGSAWQHLAYAIDTGEVGEKTADIAGGILSRPVQLTLYNGNGNGKVIDTDNIQLLDSEAKNLLANGDFSHGLDRWFFTAEKHHPWHILNMWVHLFFDQGLLGLSLFMLSLGLCLGQLCKKLAHNPCSPIFLTSLCAFCVVGWVDSPFDAPRITLLFFWVMLCSIADLPHIPQVPFKNAKHR